jgi:hypothetical protein
MSDHVNAAVFFSDEPKAEVKYGFFWVPSEGSNLRLVHGSSIRNGAIVTVPRWWEVRRWYRAFRLWISIAKQAQGAKAFRKPPMVMHFKNQFIYGNKIYDRDSAAPEDA